MTSTPVFYPLLLAVLLLACLIIHAWRPMPLTATLPHSRLAREPIY